MKKINMMQYLFMDAFQTRPGYNGLTHDLLLWRH